MKVCTSCGGEKPFDAFYLRRASRDGRQPRCKECVRAEKRRIWASRTVEERAALDEERRLWRKENSARVREHNRRHAARLREWKKINAEGYNAKLRQYRAERRGASHAELVSALVVLELHDGVCGICGEDVDPFHFDLDHIVPIKLGGFHNYENVQLTHPTCNRKKGSKYAEAA